MFQWLKDRRERKEQAFKDKNDFYVVAYLKYQTHHRDDKSKIIARHVSYLMKNRLGERRVQTETQDSIEQQYHSYYLTVVRAWELGAIDDATVIGYQIAQEK